MLSTPQNSGPDDAPPVADAALATGLAALRQQLEQIAAASHRDVRSITLLAVSKGQAVERLRAALALGLTQFGENYVDEALGKIRALTGTAASRQLGASDAASRHFGACGADAEWHFIGHLQANKTRAVAEHFSWVHGVDRERIAQRLSAHRPHHAPPLNVCVQVNIAGEQSKSGVTPEQTLPLLQAVAVLPRLRLRGLMCMLPFDLPVTAQHQMFGAMRELRDAANREGLALDTLSMGMSGDYPAAIAEGATIVRIGTALFGPRP